MSSASLLLSADLLDKIRAVAAERHVTPEALVDSALDVLQVSHLAMAHTTGPIADRAIASLDICARASAALAAEIRTGSPSTTDVLDLLGCIDLHYFHAAHCLAAVIRGAGECTGTA